MTGIIYMVKSSSGKVYVGKTIQTLQQRIDKNKTWGL